MIPSPRPFAPADEPAIREFNQRLSSNGVEFQFPEECDSPDPRQKYFVVGDDSAAILGAYILKIEKLLLADGRALSIGNYQLPISLGIVEKKFGMVGLQMLFDALKRNPFLYCLGMGGQQRPLPSLLKKLGWSVDDLPFFFLVLRGRAFTLNLEYFKRQVSGRWLLKLLRWTAIDIVGAWIYRAWVLFRARKTLRRSRLQDVQVADFSADVDSLQARVLASGSVSAFSDRGHEALSLKFPLTDSRFVRGELRDFEHNMVGWYLVTVSTLSKHKQFGSMRLATFVDALCLPGHELVVLSALTLECARRNVDLLVSNQVHARWVSALKKLGFISGPSQFTLATSPSLSEHVAPFEKSHWNRGDGDGPIHL